MATSNPAFEVQPAERSSNRTHTGMIILNADDWGRDAETTDRILECFNQGSLSSTSGMVFMEDSERAAALAIEHGVDVGLHFNFTSVFSAPTATGRLSEFHQRVARFLLRNPLSKIFYNPLLVGAFEYLVKAQLDEYRRIYGGEPRRVDGHHHMHLCANVLFAGLLPAGTIARRNFSFLAGERSAENRLYRGVIDRILARQHRMTDFFFSLPPLEPEERLDRIFAIGRRSVVEIETHPINSEEHKFLTQGRIRRWVDDSAIAHGFTLASAATPTRRANP